MPGADRRVNSGLAALAAVLSAALPATAQEVTFTRDVAPILQRSCVACHRPDSLAPMSLISYDDVRPWARAIRDKISRPDDDPDRMPPWFIEKNIGIQKFKDDPSLSKAEVALIAAWVDGGAPQGDPADMPDLDLAAGSWTIGEPDLLVASPPMTLAPVAPDFYGTVGPAPTGLTEDRYVKAVEFREVRIQEDEAVRKAGDLNFFIVHHAVARATAGPAGARQAASRGRRGENFMVVWELGQNATVYPDALGVKLPAGSALNFDLHTHSIGTEATFSIEAAFKLHPEGYVPKYTNNSMFDSLTYDLDIRGNEKTAITGLYPLTESAMVLSFEPHLHSSGRRMCVEALYPSGYQEALNCAGYNHNWVKVYYYEDDVAPLLPKGTVLKVTAWYDNTASNPRVIDPRNWKGWGSRSIDDMFFLNSRVVWLTDEEFQVEAAARAAGKLNATQDDND